VQQTGPALSIKELILAFWIHAETYYRRDDGTPAAELENLRLALRPLKRLYGTTPARDFGPQALKAVRQQMIDAGLCRRTINQRIGRIIRLFRFGVENELVPAAVHHALRALTSLRRGRSAARESRAIRPVPRERVEAVRPYLSRQLWAVVQLQQLTGMRSGEALAMRTCDLDMTVAVWEYVPARHKAEHHGKQRQIFVGPRAQEVLRPWLRMDPTEYLFQPRVAKEEFLTQRRRSRRTPLTPSQRGRTRKKSPRRAPGERYDARTYSHAIARACDRAFPHPMLRGLSEEQLSLEQRAELKAWRRAHRWHPHQLRHYAATFLRKEFGLDVVRVILGHTSPAVTEIYAEVDREKALAAMENVG
jgi:integrase